MKAIFFVALLAVPCNADWVTDFDAILSVSDHSVAKNRNQHATLHREHSDAWRDCPWYQMIRLQENTGPQAVGNDWLIGRIKNSGI